jgi:hypothetical protein
VHGEVPWYNDSLPAAGGAELFQANAKPSSNRAGDLLDTGI